MKILHSSDFHLVALDDLRWKALETVVSIAERESVDFFVISGDLFDNDTDADQLRPSIRGLFSNKRFETLIIPGNHDNLSFSSGLYFGEGVRIFKDPEWTKNLYSVGDIQFIGIPFEPIDQKVFRGKLRRISSLTDPQKTTIILYHGELLDVSFDRNSFGNESGRYMPSRLAFFEEVGIDYVLAGHFHTTFNVRKVGQNGFFVYPGSPVSVTRKELGRRKVGLIEIGKEPKPLEIDAHHYQLVEVVLNAFISEKPLDQINKKIEEVDSNGTALLRVGGSIMGSEQEFAEAINQEILNKNVELIEVLFRDVSKIIGHPVYALFESRLNEIQKSDENEITPETIEGVKELVIQAMAKVKL